MTDAYRPSHYLEYRDAAVTILTRGSGDMAVKAFGLTDLLAGIEPADDLTPVYAFLEAQGSQVATTAVLARLGLVGSPEHRLDRAAPQALLGQPIGPGPLVAVPGMTAGAPVAVDRPGVGLVVAPGDGVRVRAVPEPVADDYLTVLEVGAADAVVLPDHAMAPLRAAMLARVQLGAAAELLGLASRLLDDVIAYARIRRQFGRAISSFQVMQHLLGWAATERHQLASMYDIAVERTAHGGPDPELNATVKALAGRVVHTIAQTAIQVTGGISFTWEYSLNRPHQRALALDQFAGSSADLIAAIGRRVRADGVLPTLFGFESVAVDAPPPAAVA
jgi:Acyl-CoA dehydrogenase, C-terminal domain